MATRVLLEQTESTYDAASNVIQSTQRQRYHNATDTQLGELQTPSAVPKARVTYAASYPDPLGRTLATANYGTNGGVSLARPNTVPTRGDTVLVTSTLYDSTGLVQEVRDPAGKTVRLEYDHAGRRTKLIENHQGGSSGGGGISSSSSSSSSGVSGPCAASDDANRTTRFTYTPDGQQATLVAENGRTGDQTTTYHYGTTLTDSAIATSTLLRSIAYPDSTGSGDRVWLTYNRQGQRVTTTDQRGCVHTYEYDRLGRLTDDRVTTLGTNVDGRVRRLGVAYEVRGLPQLLTSYDAESLSGGTVLNQARFEHNNYGQRVSTYQAQTGAVNVSATPRTQTSFADGAANTVRPVSLTYPDGRVLNFDYGAAGSMSDRTSRIAALTQGSTTLAEYEHLGLGAVVRQTSPEASLRMTLVDLTGSNDPDTGDIYSGLDRFGRVDDVRWRNTSTSSDLSRVQYGYNRASSRTWRVNPSDPANRHDWQYGYDGLQRLTRADRGTLNFSGSQPSTINPQRFSQCWTLDATENWAGFRQDDDGDGTWNLAQSRTNNVVNELTGITNTVGGSWQVPAYDPAGNMTTLPQPASPAVGYTATYDAWNRLVKLTASGFQEEYRYDARNYRITQLTATETRHFYHTNTWQVIEERVGTSPDSAAAERQFVWGLRYIDDLILRDRDTDGNGTLDERLYACQDANWNVTAVVTTAGTVTERYEYDPYGTLRILTPTFGTRTTSNHAWETTYAGYRYNQGTWLYHVRFRVLSPLIGWVQRDPLGNLTSLSLYPYAASSPPNLYDPLGLEVAGYHHGYPLFLGGANGQPVFYMSQQAHTAAHNVFQRALGHRCGNAARAAWEALPPSQRTSIISQSLRAGDISDDLITQYMDDIMARATPGQPTTRCPWRTGPRIGSPPTTGSMGIGIGTGIGVAITVFTSPGTAHAAECSRPLICRVTRVRIISSGVSGCFSSLYSPDIQEVHMESFDAHIQSSAVNELESLRINTSQCDGGGFQQEVYDVFRVTECRNA